MRVRGPFVTLAAGIILGSVLFGMSAAATPATPGTPVPAGAKAGASSAPPPSTGAPRGSTPPVAPPASPPPIAPAEVSYAGRVDGGAATLAIAVKDGTAIAYLCDGKRIEAWLQGPATADGKLNLTGKANTAAAADTLIGTFNSAGTNGTVTVGGKIWTFTLRPGAAPTGLYRVSANVRNAKVVGGWIILADGTQVGVVTVNGVAASAPPLDLTTLTSTVDGIAVTADPLGRTLSGIGARTG